MEISTTQSLLEALDDRGQTPEERKSFDDEVWRQRGAKGAILVTDLSGFTRATKTHGVIHFLSIFRRFQNSCGPLLEKNGGHLFKQEADDLFAIFPSASQAIETGLEMLRTIEALNKISSPINRMGLGVGVDYGQFIQLTDDAYGDPINAAFKLGEDIARSGEVLVGLRAYEQARKEGWKPDAAQIMGPVKVDTSGVAFEHYILR